MHIYIRICKYLHNHVYAYIYIYTSSMIGQLATKDIFTDSSAC